MSKSAQKKAAKQVTLDFTATASIADGDFVPGSYGGAEAPETFS